MPDDILDAANKVKDDTQSPQTIPPWSPMGSIPNEPAPEPAKPSSPAFVTVPVDNTIPKSPATESEKMQNAGVVMDTILGTPTTYPAQQTTVVPPNPTFPLNNGNPPSPITKKRPKFGLITALFLLFLGIGAAGAFFISQQNRELADTRTSAAESCIAAVECSDNGRSCSGCPGYSYRNGLCCKTINATPLPGRTATPPRIIDQPCQVCNSNNRCVSSGITPCNSGQNECSSDSDCQPATQLSPCEEAGHMCVTNADNCTYLGNPAPTFSQSCNNSSLDCVPEGSQCTPGSIVDTTPSPIPTSTNPQCTTNTIGCTDNTCKIPPEYFGQDCFVSHYVCPIGTDLSLNGNSCDNRNGELISTAVSASFINCGIEQIDFYCSQCGVTTHTAESSISQISTTNCAGGGGGGSSPTPVPGVCANIKIYKNGVQVDPTTLSEGDAVILAVVGTGNPTKAHFRVNGADWVETITKNTAGEFVLDFTIPTGVTDFVVEAEVYDNGVWK